MLVSNSPILQQFMNEWNDKHGVEIYITELSKVTWHIKWISRKPKSKPGSGRLCLEELNKLVDVHNKILRLQVFNDSPYLHKVYEELGYIYTKHRTKDVYYTKNRTKDVYKYGPWMKRMPKKE